MLNWSMLDLARAAGVSVAVVKWMETSGTPPLDIEVRLRVWDALVRAGVRFLDDEGEGVGVMVETP